MRNLLSYCYLLFAFLFILSGCGKEEKEEKKSLNGTVWTYAVTIGDSEIKTTLIFQERTYMLIVSTHFDPEFEIQDDAYTENGTYIYEHPKVTFMPSDPDIEIYTAIISENSMILMSEDEYYGGSYITLEKQ